MNEQDNDVMALLKRMQQQLAFLEKKMDTLIQRTQQQRQPFNRPQRSWRPGHFAPKKKPFFGHGRGPS